MNKLFLGCTIVDFNMSLGWNQSSSSLTVNLVEDTCVSNKEWFDGLLNKKSGSISDPGFLKLEPGSPVYFRVDDSNFEYCGLLRTWNKNISTAGNPKYTVTIGDPRTVLDDVSVIIADVADQVGDIWNVVNAFGFIQNNISCGEAGLHPNQNGILWNSLKCALHTLLSSSVLTTDIDNYCKGGRILGVGVDPNVASYGALEADDSIGYYPWNIISNANTYVAKYLLDITEIPDMPSDYRISGDVISLADLIDKVCNDAGYNYYCELLPVRYNNNEVLKIIKIHTVSQLTQPTTNSVKQFVANHSDAVISYTSGLETRDNTVSNYLIGGNKLYGYVTTDTGSIMPFWGLDKDGKPNRAEIVNNEYRIYTDLATFSEAELRAALDGFDSWRGQFSNKYSKNKKDILHVTTGLANPLLAEPSIGSNMSTEEGRQEELIYQEIKSFAEQYYGRQFLVTVSGMSTTYDRSTNTYYYSHEPSEIGCWIPDEVSGFLGLVHNSGLSYRFRDEQLKYEPIVTFDSTSGSLLINYSGSFTGDFSKLGDNDYYGSTSGRAWIKAQMYDKVIRGTPFNPTGDTLGVVVTLPGPVVAVEQLPQKLHGLENVGKDVGGVVPVPKIDMNEYNISYGALPRSLLPSGVLVALKSNVERYGPWGKLGLPGKTKIEINDSLVPWNYDSEATLNAVALNLVANSTNTRYIERGSVSLTGTPQIPLGSELLAADNAAPVTVETRTVSYGSCANGQPFFFYVQTDPWTGVYGPTITDVNVTYGPNGLTTSYNMSSYVPRFGIFGRRMEDKISQIYKTRAQLEKKINELSIEKRIVLGRLKEKEKFLQKDHAKSYRKSKSPMNVLVARHIDSGVGGAPYVYFTNFNSLANQITETSLSGDRRVSYTSLDHFFIPVDVPVKTPTDADINPFQQIGNSIIPNSVTTDVDYDSYFPFYSGANTASIAVNTGTHPNSFVFDGTHKYYKPVVWRTSPRPTVSNIDIAWDQSRRIWTVPTLTKWFKYNISRTGFDDNTCTVYYSGNIVGERPLCDGTYTSFSVNGDITGLTQTVGTDPTQYEDRIDVRFNYNTGKIPAMDYAYYWIKSGSFTPSVETHYDVKKIVFDKGFALHATGEDSTTGRYLRISADISEPGGGAPWSVTFLTGVQFHWYREKSCGSYIYLDPFLGPTTGYNDCCYVTGASYYTDTLNGTIELGVYLLTP